MTINEKALMMHEQWNGKLETVSKSPVKSREDLSIAYTPGVAEPCKVIAQDKEAAYKYTMKSNTVAVVSDGSAVLGLGNIGPHAAMPVMEGKAVLFKEFGGVNAVPICLDTQDTEEIIKAVTWLAPGFGGINLEDISAPRCFEIEERLKATLDIPVFHDDQHGTAIVVLAGIINGLKVERKEQKDTIGAQLKKEDGVLKVNYVSADEAWNKFKDDDRAAPLSELASLVKNINIDNVQKYINNAQKAINVIQELTNKPTTNTNIVTPKTPRAMDKFFGD